MSAYTQVPVAQETDSSKVALYVYCKFNDGIPDLQIVSDRSM